MSSTFAKTNLARKMEELEKGFVIRDCLCALGNRNLVAALQGRIDMWYTITGLKQTGGRAPAH